MRLADNPVWDGSDAPTALGEPVFNTTLALKSGSVQIARFGGAAIDLQGPCQLDLESDQRVFLAMETFWSAFRTTIRSS